jgi:hypothetical protein
MNMYIEHGCSNLCICIRFTLCASRVHFNVHQTDMYIVYFTLVDNINDIGRTFWFDSIKKQSGFSSFQKAGKNNFFQFSEIPQVFGRPL